MTAKLFNLHEDEHRETQELLPWYATGQIEPADREKVEAHLAGCAGCRAELQLESRLSSAVAALPLELELRWLDLRGRLQIRPSRWARARSMISEVWNGLGAGNHVRWVAAAQFSLVLVGVALVSMSQVTSNPSAEFHALGASEARDGNVVAMFKPDTREAEIRAVLARSGARLVEGPTPAGAYVLSVDTRRRSATLASLRAEPAIMMAESLAEDAPE